MSGGEAMKDIVFAHTAHVYASYTDYRKLVELGGFETCVAGAIDFGRDAVYILSPLNGEYRPHRDNFRGKPYKAHVISWCLERPSGANGLRDFVRGQKQLLDDWYFDEIWLSDRYLVKHVNDSRVRFVPLGSHIGLGDPSRAHQKRRVYEYDYIHLSYLVGRRKAIIDGLAHRGHASAPNSWPPERHDLLMNSAFMLNIHQDNWPIIEPLRLALAAAYAMPVITEEIRDSYPYNRGGDRHNTWPVKYADFVEEVLRVIKSDYEPFRAMGWRMHALMTGEFEFGRQVKKAARELGGAPIDPVMIK
jgi:hypothetical protein